MTSSYVEVALWGELQPLEKGQVVPASASIASVAFDPARAAFRALSRCHAVQHVYSEVAANFYKTFSSIPPTGCFNPMRLMVTEITVIKRCCLVQHEGLFIGLRYQQPAPAQPTTLPQPAQLAQPTPALPQLPQPAQPAPAQPADFYLVINRDVNCRSCTKLAIECTTTQTQPSGYNYVTVWRMPFDNVNNFQLNLAQLAIILNFIADEATRYNLLAENCFWFTHATREVISRRVFNQDPDAFIVPHFWLWRIGTCFNWRVDHVGQNQINHITEQYTLTWDQFLAVTH
ncbi:hypothetical protein F5887DRAFT_991905 [Amanita rubescens]|nr:hypothetical protein F5887DRAFT_991905 [Amanita rubescens]